MKCASGMPQSASLCLSLWSLVLPGEEGVVGSGLGGEMQKSGERNYSVNRMEILLILVASDCVLSLSSTWP